MPKTKASSQRKQKSKFIPYATGFKPPSESEQRKAISAKSLPKELEPTDSFFSPVPAPTSADDWLAQYNEEGQTFTDFLEENPWISSRKRKATNQTFMSRGNSLPEKYPDGKIYLLPLGEFSCGSSPDFDILVAYAQAFFCLPVEVLPGVPLESDEGSSSVHWVEARRPGSSTRSRKITRPQKFHLDSRHNDKSGKRQLQVNSILVNLKRNIPNDALCLIALTMEDLYQAPNDLFVAGMAAGNHRVAVFSFCRYDPSMAFSIEHWWDTNKNILVDEEERMKMIIQRSCKLLVHEVSHILGVDHCIFFSCCMNGSGHLKEDFSQSMHLCPVDLHKLHFLCGFDITERYRKLLEFFEKYDLKEEGDWVKRRLEYLNEEHV